jgi:hypothetical protein
MAVAPQSWLGHQMPQLQVPQFPPHSPLYFHYPDPAPVVPTALAWDLAVLNHLYPSMPP